MSVQSILTTYGQIGVELLKQSIPKATGKTAASIHFEVTPNRLQIFGRAFFKALETYEYIIQFLANVPKTYIE